MEGAKCSSCARDASGESFKCQVRQEVCVPRWNNRFVFIPTVNKV